MVNKAKEEEVDLSIMAGVSRPSAQKELHFEANGDIYRSLLLIDAEKKRQEAYMFKWVDGDWKSLCDGKVDNYDKTVNSFFGLPQLFLPAFSAARMLLNCLITLKVK